MSDTSRPPSAAPAAFHVPEATPEPGWTPVRPFAPFDDQESFLVGRSGEPRVRVTYFTRDEDRRLVGKAWFGILAQGPPGFAHGGSIAAVLDEAMGAASWAAGYPVVVARLAVDFREMLPLGTDARLETHIERIDGRKLFVRASLTSGPTLFAEAESICVTVSTPAATRA